MAGDHFERIFGIESSKRAKVKINNLVEVKVPGLPNYLLTEENSIPIWKLTDEQLRQVGLKWIDALVEKARRKREYLARKN